MRSISSYEEPLSILDIITFYVEDKFDLEKVVIKIILNKSGFMVAQAELTYQGLKLTGYKVVKVEETMKVYPPAVKSSRTDKYVDIVRVLDRESWTALEEKIIQDYKEALKRENGQNHTEEETVDPDDIPF